VNPDVALSRIARRQRWLVEDWHSSNDLDRFARNAAGISK
jgi:hypothetical protein